MEKPIPAVVGAYGGQIAKGIAHRYVESETLAFSRNLSNPVIGL